MPPTLISPSTYALFSQPWTLPRVMRSTSMAEASVTTSFCIACRIGHCRLQRIRDLAELFVDLAHVVCQLPYRAGERAVEAAQLPGNAADGGVRRSPESGAATICALPARSPPAFRSLPTSTPIGELSTETPAPTPEPWSIEIEPGSTEISSPDPCPASPSTETLGGVTVIPAEPFAPPCPAREPLASMLTLRSLAASAAFFT